jgi:hypothetical protein
MASHKGNSSARARRITTSTAGEAQRIARKVAQSTLLAAGMIATQMGGVEMDARFHMFNPTLVDRLHAPITRHHE